MKIISVYFWNAFRMNFFKKTFLLSLLFIIFAVFFGQLNTPSVHAAAKACSSSSSDTWCQCGVMAPTTSTDNGLTCTTTQPDCDTATYNQCAQHCNSLGSDVQFCIVWKTSCTWTCSSGVCSSTPGNCGGSGCTGPDTYKCAGYGTTNQHCEQYTWAVRSGVCTNGAHANAPDSSCGGKCCDGPNNYACSGAAGTSGQHCEQFTWAVRSGACTNGAHASVANSYCGKDCCTGPTTYQCSAGAGNTNCEQMTWATRSGVCSSAAHAGGQAQNLCCPSGGSCNNGACVTPTPTPAPLINPKGTFDSASCGSFQGWACDGDNYSQAINVSFYDGSGFSKNIANITASGSRPDVASVCGGTSNHGFIFTPPASLSDGVTHQIYVYGINIGSGNDNPMLAGSPRTINCAPPTYSITGNVYVDINKNGVKDGSDTNYNGATVSRTGASSGSTATAGSGTYTMSGLNAGNYSLSLAIPSGYSTTTTNPQSRTLGPNTTANFGISQNPTPTPVPPTPTRTPTPVPPTPTRTPTPAPATFTITGNVFVDTNKNGAKDTGEANQNAATVNLSGASTGTTTTSTAGTYSFTNKLAGNYNVTLTVPSGFSATSANPRSITLGPNGTVNFGIAPNPTPTNTPTPAPSTFTITGNVYIDTNKNGVKDTGEANYTAATVNLTGVSSGSTTTNTSGVYTFSNRTAGNYNVTLTVPSGYSATTTNPVSRTLGPNGTVNFGISQNPTPTPTAAAPTPTRTPTPVPPTATPTPAPSTFTITGNVFVDTNKNGSKDTGETNQNGATLNLTGVSSGSTTTNTTGNYTFSNRTAGNYTVTLVVPSGFSATTTNPRTITLGPNGTVNFGIALIPTPTPTPVAATPTPTPAATSTITITVYDDNNGNGVKETGENGHQSVSINVAGKGAGNYTSDLNGQVTIPNLTAGNSTITVTPPTNYTTTTANPRTITLPPNAVVNFGIQPPAPTCSGGLVANPTTVTPGQTSTLTATGCTGTGTLVYNWITPDYGSTANVNNPVTTWTSPSPFAQTVTAHPSVNVCLTGNVICTPYGASILISPKFVIQGNVYLDGNQNGTKDPGESNYTGTITISSGGNGTVSYPSTGQYRVSNLDAGSYPISYSGVPTGYALTAPKPANYSVTVGSPCSPSANCDANGNASNLNFGITNSIPWIQTIGGDITGNNVSSTGGFSNQIPPGATCGSYASLPGAGGTPGIIYSGAGSATFGSGNASAVPYNWSVGGGLYPNIYTPSTAGIIKTSYSYIDSIARQAGITQTNLTTVQGCNNLANCQLPVAMPNGIYKANGSVTLANSSSYTFPANKNFIILVNGDLTIKSQLHVPIGSTVMFTVSGNIYVDPSVGESTITSTAPDLEGYFSTDKSFYVQGTNVCPTADLRLNVAGGIVANAALGGGSFINERDLCAGDNQCPVFSIAERPDFIIYAPNFLQTVRRVWQEIAP